MGILRHEITGNFTVVPNTLWAARMTMQAKAVIGCLLSKPDYWEIRIESLAREFGVGREAMRAALRSAQEAGWLYRYRQQQERGTWQIVTVVRDAPLAKVPPIDQQGCQQVTGIGETRTPVDPGPGAALDIATPNQQSLSSNRKTKTTTSSRSSRARAARREEDAAEWSDPAAAVFAKEQEPDDSEPGQRPRTARNHSPDSAWGLNHYYRQTVFVAGNGRVGNTNDGAMRKFFAEAKRVGVPAAVLRDMVDAFVSDTHLFNKTRTHRWKVFIANAPLLQDRAENVATYREGGRAQEVRVPSRGAIPQRILDKILAEAG